MTELLSPKLVRRQYGKASWAGAARQIALK
ncbi:hypothetical protein FBZ83_1179 [Azospirillum brasilense]|uniref:Uncharacterized protein n=1 Tax=Azospirillum brasilense TaxID=192 RepID=A0A560BW65_AZOBR|nr:hypothetical protein FBZ83_1179 [Azospirillum brasilense]